MTRDPSSSRADEPQNLLTPQEAAERLAISTRQLRDLTQDGCIRFVNIGRGARLTRRYDPDDLAAFVEERKSWSSKVIPGRRRGPTTSVFVDQDFRKRLEAAGRRYQLTKGGKP